MATRRLKTKLDRGKARVNLRLPADLVVWAKKWAAENHTTLTDLVLEHLLEFRKRKEDISVDQF